jgi:hypothetical protein
MLYFSTNTTTNRTTGGLGCLIGGLLIGGLVFFGAYWFLKFLWWASPAILLLAILISWRSVADTGRYLFGLLKTDPLAGILRIALAVFLFPLLSFYLLLKAIAMRQGEKLVKQFGQQYGQNPLNQQPQEDDFVDFEELESKPIRPKQKDFLDAE